MNYSNAPRAKPRFKGIENFLRRIAFNLGNTPSQTEVKIISCIPIDVTDLQNKIVELERELDTLKLNDTNRPPTTVRTALYTPNSYKPCPPCDTLFCTPETCHDTPAPHDDTKAFLEKYCLCESDGYSKNSLPKVKKMSKKKLKNRTEMVYFAQTSHRSPFTHYEAPPAPSARPAVDVDSSESFLRDVMRRQYRADPVHIDTFASEFSSPVCRDEPDAAPATPTDTDIYSCCHGLFHNLDTTRSTGFIPSNDPPANEAAPQGPDHSVYYDSSYYDVVPVKERPTKVNDYDYLFKDVDDFVQDRICKIAARSRYKPYTPTPSPGRNGHKMTYRRKLPLKYIHRRDHTVNVLHKVKLDRQRITDTSQSFSVECGEVYQKPVRTKVKVPARARVPLPPPPPPVLYRNAECITTNLNDSECQTATSRSVQLEPQTLEENNKTEITLNQIKSILHAVLTEVKTNSQIKYAFDRSVTRDAVVQKEPSQSNMANRSGLTSSIAAHTSFETPVPQQSGADRPYRQPELPNSIPPPAAAPPKPFPPLKCIQNYPLFIQTTGRQCTCCYRNLPGGSSHVQQHQMLLPSPAHLPYPGHAYRDEHYRSGHGYHERHPYREGNAYREGAHAAHTATNTDKLGNNRHSKETEKLIKEIYKSLAVNADIQKDSPPSSENVAVKSDKSLSGIICKNLDMKYSKHKPKSVVAESVSTRTKDGQGSRKTTTSEEEESGSPTTSESSGVGQRAALLGSPSPSTSTERTTRRRRSPSDRSTAASSDIDSDETIVTETRQKKEKKSLFSKMVNLFTKKSRRTRKNRSSSEIEQEDVSESDDYETVYIQRSAERVRRASPPGPRRAALSKRSNARYLTARRDSGRGRRSPFTEQGYRRNCADSVVYRESSWSRELPRRSARPAKLFTRPPSAKKTNVGKSEIKNKSPKGWFKRPKCSCAEQWKQLILEH